MLGTTYITIFMNSGKRYEIKFKNKEQFFSLILDENDELLNTLIEISPDVWIKPNEISNFEVKEKLFDW